MKRIAVLASGGDAPGMNACVRAVVRASGHRGLECFGVKDGYEGLLRRQLVELHRHDVSNIIQMGGVFLGSLRCEDFYTREGRAKGAEVLRSFEVDALVALGGDGTLCGARSLHEEHGTGVVLIPSTIDNDVPATDWSIGFDTAVNTAVEAVDRLRDTAEATEKVFFVEVMGRESGALALHAGMGSGADAILVPEQPVDIEKLIDTLNRAIKRKSRSLIVVAAEGQTAGGAFAIAELVRPHVKLELRVTVLGHIQRGGVPSARDRLLASRLGIGAVKALMEGKTGHVIGEIDGDIVATAFEDLTETKKSAPLDLLNLIPDLF
jgi:6-phosphofructokinase 1